MTSEEAAQKLDLVTTYDIPELKEAVLMAQAALRAQAEEEKNEPLTVEELREMDGEPVWVNPSDADGCWCIVDVYGQRSCQVQCVTVMGTAYFGPSYGERWLAYRCKPEAQEKAPD